MMYFSRLLICGETHLAVGERIKERRKDKKISAAELARRAGISKGYLSEIESGRIDRPSAEVLYELATALGTTIADLLQKEVRPASQQIPPSLRSFADKANIPEEDVRMLAQIRFRGEQPTTEEDWAFLYGSIKRSIRETREP